MAEIAPTELLELFQRAQAQFADRLDAVEPDQWEDEALPEWTVGDLVAHVISDMLWVPPLLAGEPQVDGRFPDSTSDLLGDDAFASWEDAADSALSAFAEDDALMRTVHTDRGPMPASAYIEELIAGLTVHAWDLARAIGADTDLPGELVTAALVVGERLPEDGVPGAFDPPLETAGPADPQARMLARFGRRPV